MYSLTNTQTAVVERPLHSHIFLHGPAGTGKTTTGVERLKHLIASGVPADSILVLTSHRILQDAYLDVINSGEAEASGDTLPATMSGLAWRVLNLFWPLAAQVAGFGHPEHPPVFLNVETAQYYMAYVIRPFIQ